MVEFQNLWKILKSGPQKMNSVVPGLVIEDGVVVGA